MTALDVNISENGFSIGDLISATFSVLHSALGPFLLLAAIPILPQLLELIPSSTTIVNGVPQPDAGMAVMSLIVGLGSAVLLFIMQGSMIYMAFGVVRGRNPSLDNAFSKGLARFLPLVGVSILAGLAIGIGILLLIVPGVWLSCMLYAVAAACVVESRGVFASMGRSAELTKGYRWKIFGLLLIVSIVNLVVTAIFSAIGVAIGGGIGAFVFRLPIQIYTTAFGSVMAALSYYALRSIKEGIDIDRIAQVFD